MTELCYEWAEVSTISEDELYTVIGVRSDDRSNRMMFNATFEDNVVEIGSPTLKRPQEILDGESIEVLKRTMLAILCVVYPKDLTVCGHNMG